VRQTVVIRPSIIRLIYDDKRIRGIVQIDVGDQREVDIPRADARIICQGEIGLVGVAVGVDSAGSSTGGAVGSPVGVSVIVSVCEAVGSADCALTEPRGLANCPMTRLTRAIKLNNIFMDESLFCDVFLLEGRRSQYPEETYVKII
jgi:hypothetical protein